jgi:hypothetical protein
MLVSGNIRSGKDSSSLTEAWGELSSWEMWASESGHDFVSESCWKMPMPLVVESWEPGHGAALSGKAS